MKATYREETFEIPDMWFAGFSRNHPEYSPADIVRWYAWQLYMERTGFAPPESY